MRKPMRAWFVLGLSGLWLVLMTLPGAAAPPGNSTNFNVDVSSEFETDRLGDPTRVHLEAHGNDPEMWPATLDFHLEVHNDDGAYWCSYSNPVQDYVDSGSSLTINVSLGETSCGTEWDLALTVSYDSIRWRGHENSTGQQVKMRGIRDSNADVTLNIQEFPNDENIINTTVTNAAFYQSVTEQFHNTGTPGNPRP